jgi:hypothetical protein
MELVRNKASGKCFVLLDDSGGSDFLVITPEGKVKRLERRLFEPRVAVEPEDTPWVPALTKTQMDIYEKYIGG